jgi:hypothetical protein
MRPYAHANGLTSEPACERDARDRARARLRAADGIAGDERVDVGVVQQDLVRAASSAQQTVRRVADARACSARIAGVASSVSPICSG